MPTRRFRALDGLRGVCALSVLFFHCNGFFHRGAFFQHGYLSVDVFFILSGFVISLTYERKLAAGLTRSAFLATRARRLFPTYWLGTSLNVALFVWMASAGFLALGDSWWMLWLFIPITTLLLIPDYVTTNGDLYPPMYGVAWSLFVEWGAYIAYAYRLFRWRTDLLALLAVVGWCAMTFAGYHTGVGWSVGAGRSGLFPFGVMRCVPAFAAGIVIYRIHDHSLFRRLPVISTEFLLIFWFGAAALPAYSATPTLDAIIITVFSPLLVCLLIRSDDKAPPFCTWLGDLSYPLYVVHPGIIMLATFTPAFGLSHGPRPLNACLVVGASLGLAWLVTKILPAFNNTLTRLSRWLASPPNLGAISPK